MATGESGPASLRYLLAPITLPRLCLPMIVAASRQLVICVALALTMGAAGCSSQPAVQQPTVYPVSGTVTDRGKPAEGVRVYVISVQRVEAGHFTSEPLTDSNGNFQCGSDGTAKGLPPGPYEVRLSWPDRVNDDQRELEQDKLRGK